SPTHTHTHTDTHTHTHTLTQTHTHTWPRFRIETKALTTILHCTHQLVSWLFLVPATHTHTHPHTVTCVVLTIVVLDYLLSVKEQASVYLSLCPKTFCVKTLHRVYIKRCQLLVSEPRKSICQN